MARYRAGSSVGRQCYEARMDGETWAWICEEYFIATPHLAQDYARKYRTRHGLRRFRRPRACRIACRVCGARTVGADALHGRCPACRRYYAATGVERPRRLWEPAPQRCGNCGADVGISQRVRPRCVACYDYRRRTGVERPARLWRKEAA